MKSNVTKEDLLAFYDDYLAPTGTKRRKIMVAAVAIATAASSGSSNGNENGQEGG